MRKYSLTLYCLVLCMAHFAFAKTDLPAGPPLNRGRIENNISSLASFTERNEFAQEKPQVPIIDVVDYLQYPFARGPIKAFSIKEGSVVAPRGRPFDIVEVHLPKYRMQLSYLSQGDIIALGDGLYRLISPPGKGSIVWISEEDWPPGIAPQTGSMFVPLQKGLDGSITIMHKGFPFASLRFLGHQQSADKKTTTARMLAGWGNVGVTPTSLEFKVQTGDIVLVAGYVEGDKGKYYEERKGYKVRAIVPAEKKTRVRGWVEFDANGIPEADLIRDKVAFIRPVPLKKATK